MLERERADPSHPRPHGVTVHLRLNAHQLRQHPHCIPQRVSSPLGVLGRETRTGRSSLSGDVFWAGAGKGSHFQGHSSRARGPVQVGRRCVSWGAPPPRLSQVLQSEDNFGQKTGGSLGTPRQYGTSSRQASWSLPETCQSSSSEPPPPISNPALQSLFNPSPPLNPDSCSHSPARSPSSFPLGTAGPDPAAHYKQDPGAPAH